ncbi:hypothetical protein Tco_0428691 [Tanacetum coccineum]
MSKSLHAIKSPTSWTINHLCVNANIVDRPIGIDESRLCLLKVLKLPLLFKTRGATDIDKDAEIMLVYETQGRYGDEEMFDTGVLDGDEEKANVVVEPSESITTTPTLTTTTAATTITAISTRPRAKGLVIHEEEQATTPTVSSQQPSQVKEHDKGKGVMVEEPMKMKKKDQISLDEELAFKLQAEEEEEKEEEEEERLAREKAQREEESNIVS